MGSGRFAVPLILLLAVTGALATYYGAKPRRNDDCRNPAALFDPYRIEVRSEYRSSNKPQQASRPATLNGYAIPEDPRDSPLFFTVKRSYGMPAWILRPTVALPGPPDPDHSETTWIDVGGQRLPAEIAYSATPSSVHFTAFFYVHDHQPTLTPFRTRVMTAARSFSSGLHPITLFAITGSAHRARLEHEKQRALEWLGAAWSHYQAACRG